MCCVCVCVCVKERALHKACVFSNTKYKALYVKSFCELAHTIEVDKYRFWHLKKSEETKRHERISFPFNSFSFLFFSQNIQMISMSILSSQSGKTNFQQLGKVILYLNWPIIHFIYFYVFPLSLSLSLGRPFPYPFVYIPFSAFCGNPIAWIHISHCFWW